MYSLYFELSDNMISDAYPKYASFASHQITIDNYYVQNASRIWIETPDGDVKWWRNRTINDVTIFTEYDMKEFLIVRLSV